MQCLNKPNTKEVLYTEKGKKISGKRLEEYIEEIDFALEKYEQLRELSEFMPEIRSSLMRT